MSLFFTVIHYLFGISMCWWTANIINDWLDARFKRRKVEEKPTQMNCLHGVDRRP